MQDVKRDTEIKKNTLKYSQKPKSKCTQVVKKWYCTNV